MIFSALLAAVALAWLPTMRHATYIREVLLAGLAAPAAAVTGLLLIGPSRAGLAAALAGWPARFFLAAVWGHAVFAWASLGWTTSVEATLPRAVELLALALWATGWLAASSGGAGAWRRLAVGHLCVGGLIALVGGSVWAWLSLKGKAPTRLGDPPIGNPNTMAVLMIFPLAGAASLLAGPALRRKGWLLPVAAVVAGLLVALASFSLARSRSGTVGLAVAAAVLIALKLRPRIRRWFLAAGLAALLVAAAAGAVFLQSHPAARGRVADYARLGTLIPRYYGIDAAWRIFEEKPASGSGAGTFLREAQPRIQPGYYLGEYRAGLLNLAHNEYAQTAAELGIPGLALLLLVLGSAVWGAWHAGRAAAGPAEQAPASDDRDDDETRRALAAGLAAAICGVAASSLADPSLRFCDFTGFFYAAAALSAGAARPESLANPAPAGARRKLVVAACGALAILAATVLWAWPDGVRECRFLKGHLALKRNDFETACPELAAAATSRGDYFAKITAQRELIEAYRLGGQLPLAVAEVDFLALRRVPGCPILLRRLAICRLSAGDRAEAIEALLEAGRHDPFSSEVRDLLVRSFAGEPAERRTALADSTAARLQLPAAERAALRSFAFEAGADHAAAVGALDGLGADEIPWLPLELWRGRCLYAAGRKEEAIAALERHTELVPLHAEGWRTLSAMLNETRGQAAREEVILALRRCLRIEWEDDDSRVGLALNLLAAGRAGEVEDVLLPRLPLTVRPVDFALVLAEAYVATGRHDRARAVLEHTWERTKSEQLRQAIDRLDAMKKPPPPAQ